MAADPRARPAFTLANGIHIVTPFQPAWGAAVQAGGVSFSLWAPSARSVSLVLQGERLVPLRADPERWYRHFEPGVGAGETYQFEIDGELRVPDPASRFQPRGLDGPSEVIDPAEFQWPQTAWSVPPFEQLALYELHIGTFTPEGTYDAAIGRLDHLVQLGVNAIELLPVAQAPGTRNWGYDGVLLYAPAYTYGRPEQLKNFIAAAHDRGLAVFLDVVYNHFGPQGNYLYGYARPFFTDRHTTPWGDAIDYSSPGNEPVRRYAIDNAYYWLREYRFDGLRLDATQAIYDDRPHQMLHELASGAEKACGHTAYLIVENDDNDVRLLSDYDAQWNDDVHHALHVLTTSETFGYYGDYVSNTANLLARALTSGFAYQGEPSPFRGGRNRGSPAGTLPLSKFVNFLQNHDQIGNRAFGRRITSIADVQAVRAALAVVLLAPSPPMLFMGQEWGASTPFLFFCDFEPHLAENVRNGRRNGFKDSPEFSGPAQREQIPDPGAPETFQASKLRWDELAQQQHREWLELHRKLLALRREYVSPFASAVTGRDAEYRIAGDRGICARWRLDSGSVLHLDANLSSAPSQHFCDLRHSGENVIFTTHPHPSADGAAAPWSVRWSLE